MISDPLFYAVALPAIVLFGISKGGFAGGFGILSVPLMALVIPPTQAAAIMLPILVVMDWSAIWAYRRDWDPITMRQILPAGIGGVVLGMLGFQYLSSDALKILLAIVSIGFVLYRWTRRSNDAPPAPRSRVKAAFWSALAGLSSFIAHAGGPPLNIYLLPQRLPSAQLVGTTVVFFTIINAVKLIPYFFLGLFSTQNLRVSLLLMPAGVGGVYLGLWLRKRVSERMFYRLIYFFLVLTGCKLGWDGVYGLWHSRFS